MIFLTAGLMAFLDYEFKNKPHITSDYIPGLPMARQARIPRPRSHAGCVFCTYFSAHAPCASSVPVV